MSNIDFTKPVETVIGIPVQIISTSGREPYPVVGYVGEHSVATKEWTVGGLYNAREPESDYNLRNKATQPEEPWAAEKAAFAAGETIQYSSDIKPTWTDVKDPFWVNPSCSSVNPRYRIKPKPQKVPLEPCDVPPGSVIRGQGEAKNPNHAGWCMITSASATGIRIWRHSDENPSEITWQTLMDAESQVWRPTDTEWQPCCKEI